MKIIFSQSNSLLVHMRYKNAFAGTVAALYAKNETACNVLVLSITTVSSLLIITSGQSNLT